VPSSASVPGTGKSLTGTAHLGLVEAYQLLFPRQKEVHVGVAPGLALVGEPLHPRLVLAQRSEGGIHRFTAVGWKAVARRCEVLGQLAKPHRAGKDTGCCHIRRHGLDDPDFRRGEAGAGACRRLARPLGVEDCPGALDGVRLPCVHGTQELPQLRRRGLASLQERTLVPEEGLQLGRREAVGAGILQGRCPANGTRIPARCPAGVCSATDTAQAQYDASRQRAAQALTVSGALVYDIRRKPAGGLEARVRVFLVRHADADADIPVGLDDAARSLTVKAREKVFAHFAALQPRMEGVALILTSPLVRAVQTAQILALAQELEVPLRADKSLLPDMPVGSLDGVLADHPDENLVLVGHNPSMPAMAAHLLSLQAFPRAVAPGTVIGLERSPGSARAHLLFFAAPGQPVATSLGV
jgi:phosphohistidine phosphatase